MSDTLINAVAEVKEKIAEQFSAIKHAENWRELTRLYAGLGVLEELCGVPKTELTTLLGISSSDDGVAIDKYEFAGLPPLEAAKKFLKKISPKQKVASLDEIITALKTGNLDANRDDLRTSLSRSTVEIYKAGEDIYGLVENFPHIKRGSPGRRKSATLGAVVEVMKNQAPISLNKAVEQAEAQANAETEGEEAK